MLLIKLCKVLQKKKTAYVPLDLSNILCKTIPKGYHGINFMLKLHSSRHMFASPLGMLKMHQLLIARICNSLNTIERAYKRHVNRTKFRKAMTNMRR